MWGEWVFSWEQAEFPDLVQNQKALFNSPAYHIPSLPLSLLLQLGRWWLEGWGGATTGDVPCLYREPGGEGTCHGLGELGGGSTVNCGREGGNWPSRCECEGTVLWTGWQQAKEQGRRVQGHTSAPAVCCRQKLWPQELSAQQAARPPRATSPLPPLPEQGLCPHSWASIPAELWLAPPSQRARVLQQLLGSPGWWGGSCTSHLLCYSCTCLPPGIGTAPESTQPRGTKTGHPTEVSTQQQRSPYSAPSKGEGGSLGKVRMTIWSIKHLVCTMLSKDAVNTSKHKCGWEQTSLVLQLWHRNRFPAPAGSQPWLCVRFQPPTGTG